MNRHAKLADALPPQPHCRSEHQVGPVGLQQICGTHVGFKALGNQGHHVHEGFGGLTLLGCEIRNLLESENITFLARVVGRTEFLHIAMIRFQT